MDTKYLFKNENSCIAIKDDKLYIISTKYKDYSARAVTVIPGFQIELGRSIKDIEQALKGTRLPVILKLITETGDSSYYQIIRMHTGKVDDKVVATLVCKNDIIMAISFNRELLRDSNYRRYNQLSVFHQIAIAYDLTQTPYKFRREQVMSVLSSVISISNNVDVSENSNQLTAITNEDGQKLKFLFVCNRNNNNRYELTSISIQK